VLRVGARPSSVPASVLAFLDAAEGLDEKKIAVFSVYTAWPGTRVEALKQAGALHAELIII
jgi:hypothetical protein